MRRIGEFGPEIGKVGPAGATARRATRLCHEARDHPVEDDPVIESPARQFLDARDMAGGKIGPQPDDDFAAVEGHDNALAHWGLPGAGMAIWRPLAACRRQVKALAVTRALLLLAVLLPGAAAAEPPLPPARPAQAGTPVEAADAAPAELPPVPPPDPALLAPLLPLEAIERRRLTDFVPPPPPEVSGRYRVEVEGLKPTEILPAYRATSTLWQGRGEAISGIELANRIRTDERLVAALLAQEGWFDATVAARTESRADETVVILAVDPGPRFKWEEIAIDAVPPGRVDLIDDFALMPGLPIRLKEVEEAEAAYRLRLATAGFPFAELGPRDIEIDSATATGTYLLTGLLGPEAVFGQVRLEGFRPFSDSHAQVIARFRPSDPWSGMLVDDYRRALVMTRLMSNVTVRPEATDTLDAQGRVITDLVVTSEEAPRRSLAALVGYSTDEGIRAEGRWQNRNIWQPEGTLTVRGVVGTIEQRIEADVRKSNFGRRDRFLTLGTRFLNQDQPAYRARSFGLGAAIGRESTMIWQKRWTWQTGLELLQTREQDKVGDTGELGEREAFTIFAAPTSGGYDRSDDLLNPTSGFRIGLQVSPEGAFAGGEPVAYVRMQGDASAYWSPAENLVIAGRVRLGSIVGTDTANIAPSRRIYAGGGGSIRGYSFQSVGPQAPGSDGELVPVGGRGLFESGVEARYRFGDFGVVAFLDAGQAVDAATPSFDDLRFGAGLGVRYFTSIGPLRLDLARAINRRPQDPQVVVYISIGQAF